MNVLVQKKHRFNVEEYYRMAEVGVLKPGARVELLDGEIIDRSPIGPFHAGVVGRLVRFFGAASNGRWHVWPQNPLRLDEHSEPQPDVTLLRLSPDDYTTRQPGPDDAHLVIEVSDTSLAVDREVKLPAYGRAGIGEVWVVNLTDQTVEVYRGPNFTGYSSKTILRAGEKASSQAFPDVAIGVTELLRR